MSLRNKIISILGIVAILYVAADVVLLRRMIAEPFRALEESAAETDVQRVEAGLQQIAEDLQVRTRAIVLQSSTLDVLRGQAEPAEAGFERQNLLADLELNLLVLVQRDGRVLYHHIEESRAREPIRVREFPSGQILEQHPVNLARRGGPSACGWMSTERGPLIVAAEAILEEGGEEAGLLIAGRFFDDELRREFFSRSKVDVEIWSVDGGLPPEVQALQDRVTGDPGPHLVEASKERLEVYSTFDNILGRPALILRSGFGREISRGGERIYGFALLSTLATALLLLFVLLRLLNSGVIRPLALLTRHTTEIGRTEDMSARVRMERNDEIGTLSREFDGLMEKLEQSRAQVIKTSRLAGMSEIATGVLHNVGNVLNSVNVSTSLVKRKAEHLAVADLRAMQGVLKAHADDLGAFWTQDPRGRQFLPFLEELTRTLEAQRQDILVELRALNGGMEHIMELVRSQQRYAGLAGVFEPTDLAGEIDSALSMCGQAQAGAVGYSVKREFEDLPKVSVDRNRLMEILVNLIQNARQALEEAGVPEKRLTLRLRRDGPDHACIEVVDNGVGISEENLTRIFAHGFTTKKGGHGFGLHVSANAATEMKATLRAESPGPGRGATFLLRLPMRAPEVALAA
jgi:signal transduction histidine kinase